MKRVGEDPDKPLKEQSYDVDESELRTYDSANKKVRSANFVLELICFTQAESETTRQDAGDREDRDWGAWKPRSRQVKVPEEKEKQVN